MEGHSDNYIKVQVPFQPNLRGEIREVILGNIQGDGMNGTLAQAIEVNKQGLIAVE